MNEKSSIPKDNKKKLLLSKESIINMLFLKTILIDFAFGALLGRSCLEGVKRLAHGVKPELL